MTRNISKDSDTPPITIIAAAGTPIAVVDARNWHRSARRGWGATPQPLPRTRRAVCHAVCRVAALVWRASLLAEDLSQMSALAVLHLRIVGLLPDGTPAPLSGHAEVERHTSAMGCLNEASAIALQWDVRQLTDDAAPALLELLLLRDALTAGR